MKENIPQNVLNVLNNKIKRSGHEIDLPDAQPAASTKEALKKLVPKLDGTSLGAFSSLEEQLRVSIIEDTERQISLGKDQEDILDRIRFLIKEGIDLEDMDLEKSDVKYHPKPNPEESKLRREMGGGIGDDD